MPQEAFVNTSEYWRLHFVDAAKSWLETRREHLSPRTILDYSYYIKQLDKSISEIYREQGRSDYDQLHMQDISDDLMRAYQFKRRQQACFSLINKECSIITLVRERMEIPLKDYHPLPPPKDYETPGRKLTQKEEAIFEEVCVSYADHARLNVAALCGLLSLKTGMGPGEILSLQWENVHTDEKPWWVFIPRRGAKRERRERKIVLRDRARWAMEKVLDRATRIGSTDGHHYIFPQMNPNRTYNPVKPCIDYHISFGKLLKIAGIKFRRYDLRHHAVSKALSDGRISIPMATLQFGHIAQKMIRKYYHGDLETLDVVARALAGLKDADPGKKPAESVNGEVMSQFAEQFVEFMTKAMKKKA